MSQPPTGRRVVRRSRPAAASPEPAGLVGVTPVPATAQSSQPPSAMNRRGSLPISGRVTDAQPLSTSSRVGGASSSASTSASVSAVRSGRDGKTAAADPAAAPSVASLPPALRAQTVIDRAAFSTLNFSSPTMVNNIANRILYPILARHRAAMKRAVDGGGTDGGSSKLRASDGSPLFSSPRLMPGLRSRYEAAESAQPPVDHRTVAGELSSALDSAWQQVSRLLTEEELTLRRQEVRCKRVEIMEKRQLAAVRLGLEATSTRLQAYEDRVSNAQAATAGIEQHLSQSNARVQRGKSVSQLLRFFKMFTSLSPADLSGALKALSKARVAQRTGVTARWEHGRVSAFNPKYFTTVVNISAATAFPPTDSSAAPAPAPAEQEAAPAPPAGGKEKAAGAGAGTGAATTPADTAAPSRPARRGVKSIYRRGARDAGASASVSPAQSRGQSPAPSAGSRPATPPASTAQRARLADAVDANTDGGDADDGSEHTDDISSSSSEERNDDVDEEGANVMRVKMARAEAAAVAAGLDRMFAVRSYTEAQVGWCQRLLLLAAELGELARNAKNIEIYAAWLRQELVSDLFHVIARFNDFYDRHTQTAVHTGYGRALLKTMELVSRLYTTLTPSNDALLTVFFSRAVNDLGVTLFSEYSPRPLPSQPPLPGPTPLLAMDYFRQHTDGELRKAFAFLVDQLRRDVTVVETIIGQTSTARQQLLSQVTEGVIKRFIEQQVKLAETFKSGMLTSEAELSPRSKRKCGGRVADAIAYHHTVEVRLFSCFQNLIEELRKSFSAAEVDCLSRYTEAIFTHRGEYSDARTELELLNRYYTLSEEQYTRSLHPLPDEYFDLREAHMQKTKEMLDRLGEVATRVTTYALPKQVGPYILDIIKCALSAVGSYLDGELQKTFDSLKADRENWRLRPKSEDELLKPAKPESQQCGFRMLLFAQSSLMSLNDAIAVVCMPLLQNFPRLIQDVDDARTASLETLDERAERLLNMCAQAIVIRSLSVLMHYQVKTDYLPKDNKNKEMDDVAPPCTRACTLFCYYVTRQFEESKEFIRLSNGQVARRQTASQVASGANLGAAAAAARGGGGGNGLVGFDDASGAAPHYYGMSATVVTAAAAAAQGSMSAVRARTRTMNLQQLLYGDGGPSSFVRTLGVSLYLGISTHLKSFTVNDRGALVYKQDVNAYKESMLPLTSTPGLGGAVVDTLFQILKETSSLLIMPLDHIKEVKDSGTLRLVGNEEKLRYIRIRQDVKAAFKVINY